MKVESFHLMVFISYEKQLKMVSSRLGDIFPGDLNADSKPIFESIVFLTSL